MASYLSVLIQAAEPANYKLNYDEHYMISVPFATTTTPGVASFDSDYFKVVNGVVSLSDEYTGNLNVILDDIADLQEGKVDKIVPEDAGIFAYVVRKVMGQVIDYAIEISQDADADTIAMRYTNGRLKVGDGVDNADAVNKAQLTAATTNIPKSALATAVQTSLGKADTAYQKPGTGIPETDLSSDVRTKLNKAISRVGISPADWETLPVADRDINTMYFVGPYGTAPNQYFVEWMYFVNNGVGTWEAIGSTLAVDLSNYFTKSEINALLAGKANVDGVYSGMSVGHADIANQINTDREIEGAETACPPTVFGTVGGAAEVQNGLMPFPEVHGNTIKWNQLAECTNNTYDREANTISSKLFTYRASHKYLAVFDYEIESSVGNIYFLFGIWNDSLTNYSRQIVEVTALKGRVVVLFNSAVGDVYDGDELKVILQHLGTDISAANKVSTSNIQFFDLTAIYGAGKEPTTVTEFVRDFPLSYYEYDPGTLLSSKSASVDFVKRNQWDEEWEVGKIGWSGSNLSSSDTIRGKNYTRILGGETYYVKSPKPIQFFYYDANKNFIEYEIESKNNKTFMPPMNACYLRFYVYDTTYGTTYNHDICIYINWDTPGLPYVPYSKQTITLPNIELRSAGSAYDVLYQQGGGKRRIGTVDLGTLDWTKNTNSNSFYSSVVAEYIGSANYGTVGNFICANYSSDTYDHANSATSDKICGFGPASAKRVSIYDSSFASMTADQFKTAMSGVMLYYELATETDITLEENPGWTEYAEIDNFGTVKFNQDPAQTIPVPQAYFVRYTVNLVEFLDSLFVHCGGDVSKIALTN